MSTTLSEADKANEVGKAAFARNDYRGAIEAFSKSIELKNDNPLVYSNRAAAYTSLAKQSSSDTQLLCELAIKDADKAISLDKKFVKAYTRKGTAYFVMKKIADARRAYDEGLKIDPLDKGLLEGYEAVQKAVAAAMTKKKQQSGGNSGSSGGNASDKKTPEQETKNENIVIGIDLGTTYSCVTYWKDNNVIVIPNDQGQMTTPSYVSFSKSGKRIVGQAAKQEAPRNPQNTIFDVKRFIGQTLKDDGVAQDVRRYPYKVIEREAGTGRPAIEIETNTGKKIFAPEEISAFVLSYLKRCAEKYLGRNITQAVITVPAYFNDSQRAATKAAGSIAGLEVLRIINEPTAAALAYGLDKKSLNKQSESKTILVFDLGGGTFDVSVLSINQGVFQVLSTGGDTRLGGEDIDHAVYEYLIDEMGKQGFPPVWNEGRAQKRIMMAIEKAKRELSQTTSSDIHIDALVARTGDQPARDFNFTLTRTEFERLGRGLFQRCMDTVKHVLKDSGVSANQVDDIVLVGGSTRIPKIQSMLSEYFGGKELCKTLNPDEAVAFGAAVQGAILSGARTKETRDLLLMDVTPLSLGIETVGRVMSVIIPRNTQIPCVRRQIYTTEENYQTEVDISVYEGERPKTALNHFLGEFQITGVERAKRGEPKIEVSFSIDSNGILQVSAVDMKTGSKANIEIARGSRASEEEVQKMTDLAAEYAAEDEETAKAMEARNKLEERLYHVQSMAEGIKEKSKDGREGKETLLKVCADMSAWMIEHDDNASEKDYIKKMNDLELAVNNARRYF